MEDKRNLLVDSFPSSFVFVLVFSLLFVVSFFVARGLANLIKIDNLMSIRFILMYVTLYGLCGGVILGAFQKKIGFVFVGGISGSVGSWINWAAAGLLIIWGVCYGAILSIVSLVKQDSPVWTLMNAKVEMAEALAKSPTLIFGAAFVVGILLLIAYSRLGFNNVYPSFSTLKLPLVIFVSIAALVGIVLAFLAPRVTQKEFINESMASLPKRTNIAAVQGVNAVIGVHLVKFSGFAEEEKKPAKTDGETDVEPPPRKIKPDEFFGDYTITIKDGNVSVAPGLVNTQANIAIYQRHWMQIARGEQTFGSALDMQQASFTGSEEILRAADPYFAVYEPPLHPSFTVIIIIAAILLIGSFSIAPMLCIYDAFHYWAREWTNEVAA